MFVSSGGASSGKSTFIKQLRIHHGDGFPEEVRASLRPQVCENLTDALTVILDQMKVWAVDFSDLNNKVSTKSLILFSTCTELKQILRHVKLSPSMDKPNKRPWYLQYYGDFKACKVSINFLI